MSEKQDPKGRQDEREQDNRSDRKQRKLAREGGKKAEDFEPKDFSNTGGREDNRSGELHGNRPPIEDEKIEAIPSDKITGYERGNNEDDLSNRAKEDRSSR